MKNRMELFENAPVWKAYFTISLPVVFSMVVTLVYNMVDTFFVAGTQNASLVAGVSQCTPLFMLMPWATSSGWAEVRSFHDCSGRRMTRRQET